MANKRMFSKQITTSDAFVDMPVSTQLLYFHLNMEADDDGFVANPKRIMRMLNAGEDDLRLLLAKRFLLAFESGVVVIKHWLLHNAVRKDMYKETQYLDEKKQLQIKDNGVYTDVRNESVTEPVHRLDQIRLGKVRITKTDDFDDFWNLYPKHVGKKKSKELWMLLSIEDKTKILDDIPKRKLDRKWIGGFIKDPERYIKHRQWEDDIIEDTKVDTTRPTHKL